MYTKFLNIFKRKFYSPKPLSQIEKMNKDFYLSNSTAKQYIDSHYDYMSKFSANKEYWNDYYRFTK